jgi:gas vesicle structural protein
MPVERSTGGTSLIDVLDRVLDKGIVIDAWVRVSLVGIDLITVEARVVVASIDTYIKYSEAVSAVPAVSKPLGRQDYDALLAENTALRAQLDSAPAARAAKRGRAKLDATPAARAPKRGRRKEII